jgi:two-component system phosphate regulon sensor histidine kinase PhoR
MDWLPARLLAALGLVAILAAIGGLAAGRFGWPVAGAVLGAVAAVLLVVLRDALKAGRLMAWMRVTQGTAPRDRGLWGELAYRIERALYQRERSIREERERLEQFLAAIEASPNGVMMLDDNDQMQWCNRVAAEHFGLDPVGDRLQRLTNLVRAPVFVAHLQGGVFEEAVVMPSPSGRATLSVLVRPYGQGQKLLLSQDITERERSDAMRRDFVANVSHEIRTPLTVLSGFVETLAQLQLTEPERLRVLQLMGQQTSRMQGLVADLLTLATLEGSPRPPVDRWLALSSLVERARADALALSAGRHELHLAAGPALEIAGSEGELLSAIGNLLNNAVRYTPSGGVVQVSWQARDDGGLRLEVADSGVGIAREHLPRLTERFYRVDGSRSRETGGTGLGLSIVKHVVQRHGGEIEIASEPGVGSTFALVFPSARVRNSVAQGAPQPAAIGEAAAPK